MSPTFRVGVDIGGTFTDIVLVGSDGSIHTKKVSSSVENYAAAIVDGLAELFSECPSENILNPLNHLWFKVVT